MEITLEFVLLKIKKQKFSGFHELPKFSQKMKQ